MKITKKNFKLNIFTENNHWAKSQSFAVVVVVVVAVKKIGNYKGKLLVREWKWNKSTSRKTTTKPGPKSKGKKNQMKSTESYPNHSSDRHQPTLLFGREQRKQKKNHFCMDAL